jgi:hypothetical protein
VGFLDLVAGVNRLDATRRRAELEAARHVAVSPMQVGLQSPMSDQSALNAVVWADLTGGESAFLSRPAAMGIPALARQRHLLCGSVARCPLVVMKRDTPVDPAAHRWAYRTDGVLSPYHRMLWTADDLLYFGWSLWRATRGVDELLAADRVPMERWSTDVADRILVDGQLVDDDEVILIPGPHEGILNFGSQALRRMIDNLDAAATAARNPSAYLELHYTGDEPLTDDQIDTLISRWAEARRGLNGGVSYTGRNVELKEHGTHESHLLIEGRNADAIDASRLVSSPAAMADATAGSLTYETVNGRNGQFLDLGVSLYMDAIAARLSMDDVVARGLHVAFDTAPLSGLVRPATGPTLED